jgi:UDP:flavonoid glycosyltransferase YjiC (YdhE family)
VARVLLAWELGGGAGHCTKLALVADGLLARGHEVWFAARHLVSAKNACRALDVRFVQAPFLSTPALNPIIPTRNFAHVLQCSGFGSASELEVLSQAWQNLFATLSPHAVICDHAPAALLASRWFSHRRIVIGTGFTLPPAVQPFPLIEYWTARPGLQQVIERDERQILDRVNELLLRSKLSPLTRLAELYSEVDASFLLCFAELDHYSSRPAAEYLGALLPSGGDRPNWPSGNGPRVFGYLKSPQPTSRLLEFLAFVREAKMPTLIYMPGCSPRIAERLQSSQFRFVSEPVDIPYLATQCNAAVLNGGPGSVAAFLLAGIPQLNIPLHLEQWTTAHRVAELGAGLFADPARPDQMSARLLAVLHNRKFHAAAQGFASRYPEPSRQSPIQSIVAKTCDLLDDGRGESLSRR